MKMEEIHALIMLLRILLRTSIFTYLKRGEGSMFKVILTTRSHTNLAGLASVFEVNKDVHVFWAASGSQTLDRASETHVDLVVTDENLGDMTGLELVERLLKLNPMINCALVSPLSSRDFHNTTEGLGLMAQLSPRPKEEAGEELLNKLKKLKGLEAGFKDA